MVYKLVELDKIPRIKFSEELEKTTIPCGKSVIRIFKDDSIQPTLDIICLSDEVEYLVKSQSLKIWEPFTENYQEIKPMKVEVITELLWDKGRIMID